MSYNEGIKINTVSVDETSSKIKESGQNYKEKVEEIYNIVEIAKEEAWQGENSDSYYAKIQAYKACLNDIAEIIDEWHAKIDTVVDNFTTAASNIQKDIDSLR